MEVNPAYNELKNLDVNGKNDNEEDLSNSMSGTEIKDEEIDVDVDSIIDDDVRVLGKGLQNTFTELVNTSMNHISTVKQRLLDEKDGALRQRDSFYMDQLNAQQETINTLTEKVAQTEARNEFLIGRFDALKENAADVKEKYRNVFTSEVSSLKIFVAWKDYAFEVKRIKKLDHLAICSYNRVLINKAFGGFVSLHSRNAVARERNKAEEEFDLSTKKLIETYETSLARSKKELKEAHRVAAQEQIRRQQLEEDLRRTFLKNMTNMNMEALALFHKAGPNSTTNVRIPQPGEGTENDNNNSNAPRKMPPPVPTSQTTTQQPLRSKDVQQS